MCRYVNVMLQATAGFFKYTRSIFYKKQGKNETSGVSYFSKIMNGFCF